MVSFGVENRISIAADADEVYEEFEIENRLDRPLILTVIPDQHNTPREPCFGRKINNDRVVTAVSDLGAAGPEGWRMEIPAKGKRTARVGLLVQKMGEPAPAGYFVADLAARVEKGQRGTRELLHWASEQLPRIYTQNKQLDEFYKRSILTVLNCRLSRPDLVFQPFYESGPGVAACWQWDTSFSSEMLAVLDPVGLKETLRVIFHCGQGTMIWWNSGLGDAGKIDYSGYGQHPFALIRLVSDYMRLTGDTAFLDEAIDGKSVLQLLKLRAVNMNEQYARPDGLLDFGGGTGKWLEIRTSGYEYVVAAANGMAANYYSQLAQWCRDRNDPEAAKLHAWAEAIWGRLSTTLWNQEAGWYENHYPDGSRHLVISYHQFDLLDLPAIPLANKQRMISRIREGEFLGPYGMFSIARSDRAHWDREDCDWGGGGQYIGCPLRVAESLYRMNEPGKAWDVLSRCIRWVERFPYFPQSTYADNLILQPHQQDWALQISGGGGVQAVVFGLFGIHPAADGSMDIAPFYNPSLGEAKLTGYRFRNHVYDVVMNARKFQVYCDGRKVAENSYKKHAVVRIPAMKEKNE